MRIFLAFIFFIVIKTSSYGTSDTLKVLFIGNSLTFYHDMPLMFKDIALSKDKMVEVTMHAPGGVGFASHVTDPVLYNTIRSTPFDIVIMQPGTNESGGISATTTATANWGLTIMDSVKKYNACAQFFLYEISNGVGSASTYSTYFLTQKLILDSTSAISAKMQVPLIPAGECFRAYYTVTPDLLLHSGYGDVHPSNYGSYLVACSAYAAVFQDNVYPSTAYYGITPSTAVQLQKIADSIVLNNLDDWNLDIYNSFADFDFTATGTGVDVTSTSVNYDSLSWDFGDGSLFSTGVNETHVYSSYGTYIVTLTIYKGICAFTCKKELVLTPLSVSNEAKPAIRCYPNPASNYLFIQADNELIGKEYSLCAIDGKIIVSGILQGAYTNIDLSYVDPGAYILVFESNMGEPRRIIRSVN